MLHSRQAFSAPSSRMLGSNPKGHRNSTASTSMSSTISTPCSERSASKPRDSNLKREQNPRYRHDNGLITSCSSLSRNEAETAASLAESKFNDRLQPWFA